jgi:hypothetical protein
MKYELHSEISANAKRFDHMAIANIDILCRLMDKDSAVMFILGAECFDDKKHVVHPRGIRRQIHKVKRVATNKGLRQPLVVVAAESYKRQVVDLTNSRLYSDHFDRIEIYEPEDIDIIVTDKTTYPLTWENQINTKLNYTS